METIKQKWVIPEDHKVRVELEVPQSIPPGEAEVVVVIGPCRPAWDTKPDWMAYAGCLQDSPIFQNDAVQVQRALRDEWD